MDEKILQIIKLANSVNEQNEKLYAHIEYVADNRKKLLISIVDKETFTTVETLRTDLANNPYFNWNTFINTINCYARGDKNE